MSSAAVWATAVGAHAGMARDLQRGQRRAMRVTDFKRHGRTLVTLCEIAGLGHSWSGGSRGQLFSDPLGPDATRMTWAFASAQFDKR
ncbi:hypothetical protein D9M69_575180 [compost metagenome]